MPFVQFVKSKTRKKLPNIAIWSHGHIGFNKGTVIKYKIQNYKYALVYFDKDTRRIGITLTNDDKEIGKRKFFHRKTGPSIFYARSFLSSYEIDFRQKRNYHFEYDQNTKMFIIDLNNGEIT